MSPVRLRPDGRMGNRGNGCTRHGRVVTDLGEGGGLPRIFGRRTMLQSAASPVPHIDTRTGAGCGSGQVSTVCRSPAAAQKMRVSLIFVIECDCASCSVKTPRQTPDGRSRPRRNADRICAGAARLRGADRDAFVCRHGRSARQRGK